MFSITDNERLRDAYALLMFMQSDAPASAEKRAAVKNLAATIKREIRDYNNRPVPRMCALSVPTMTAVWSLVQLPDKLDEDARRWTATNWFLNHLLFEELTTAPMTAQGGSSRIGSMLFRRQRSLVCISLG